MINLTVEEITHLHKKLIEKTGGMPGLRDFGMLESVVYSTMQSFGEEDVYPTPYERAARLAYAITMNYPFCDGNVTHTETLAKSGVTAANCFVHKIE